MKLLHVDVNSPGTCDEVGVFSEKGRRLAEGWSGREASLQRLYLSCGSGGRKAFGFTAPFQCTESRNSERGGRGGRGWIVQGLVDHQKGFGFLSIVIYIPYNLPLLTILKCAVQCH